MWQQTRGLESRRMFVGLAKICLAGLLLASICWLANYWWLDAWEHLRFFEKLFALLATIFVSAAAFFGVAFLLHVDEVRDVFDLVRRKVRRSGGV
jgi:peptidoglycan biosynthesis protein MviN/MurJ (putative lipid II flippase)